MPPIRCAVWYALENRADYGEITVVYGARTVADLVFLDELDEWSKARTRAHHPLRDPGGETPDWKGEIGFVPHVFERAQVAAKDPVVLVIGPPIMIKNTAADPRQDGRKTCVGLHQYRESHEVRHRQVRAMQRWAHLRLQRGPVLTMEQLQGLPADY